MKNKIKRAYQSVAGEVALIWLWIKNLYFVFISTNSRVRVFEGYMHFWFAKKYADKRYKISQINKFCGGKRHYVIPAGNYTLAVVNQLEVQSLKARGVISKRVDIMHLLKNAYYVTEHKNLKKDENK